MSLPPKDHPQIPIKMKLQQKDWDGVFRLKHVYNGFNEMFDIVYQVKGRLLAELKKPEGEQSEDVFVTVEHAIKLIEGDESKPGLCGFIKAVVNGLKEQKIQAEEFKQWQREKSEPNASKGKKKIS